MTGIEQNLVPHEQFTKREVLNKGQLEVLGLFHGIAEFLGIPPVEVIGYENIPPPPHILASNHRGWYKIYAIWSVWPYWPYFMTRDVNFKIPVLKGYCQKAGMFPVRRGTVDRTALGKGLDVLEEGHVLGMFFEGTRGRGEKVPQLKPARRGTAHLALEGKVPIVPVVITGTEKIVPLIDELKLSTLAQLVAVKTASRKPLVRMVIGRPIRDHLEKKVNADELTNILVHQVQELLES